MSAAAVVQAIVVVASQRRLQPLRMRLLPERAWSLAFTRNASRKHGSGRPIGPSPVAQPAELFAHSHEEPSEHLEIEQRTRDWVEHVVIGLNLCPFAERPWIRTKLQQSVAIEGVPNKTLGKIDPFRIEIVRGNDLETILAAILAELWLRKEGSCDEGGTSLVVCPECYPDDFRSYLDVVQAVEEDLLERWDLTDDLQVAPFHPRFQFAGTDDARDDEASNWTNRSPYPTFHILRQDQVSQAVDRLEGDASRVWQRNVNLLTELHRQFGWTTFGRILSGSVAARIASQQDSDRRIRIRLREILQNYRVKLLPSRLGDPDLDDE
jgi:uncharacterized protein